MSSSFFSTYGYNDRNKKITAIKDINAGKGYPYYLKKFVNEEASYSTNIDWKQRYISNNFMNFVLEEFLSFTPVEDTVIKEDGSAISNEEKDRLRTFLEEDSVDWDSIWFNLISDHKLCGDAFAYYTNTIDSVTGKMVVSIKMLPSENVTIYRTETGKIIGYKYSVSYTYYDSKEMETNPLNPTEKTANRDLWFTYGFMEIYENQNLLQKIPNMTGMEDKIQVMHYNGMREPITPYSKIPYEKIVDQCLMMDSIDTDINHINKMTGSPTVLAIDCGLDLENSCMGAGGIVYFDSVATKLGEASRGQVSQLEITNGLDSYLKQRQTTIDILYEKANLIPPSLIAEVLRSDSAKVIASIKRNLTNEILNTYKKMSNISSELISLVASDFKEISGYRLKTKTTLDIEALIDQYIIKAYKSNLGELNMKSNLTNEGLTQEQIDVAIKEHQLEIEEKNNKEDATKSKPPIDNNVK